MKEILLSTVFTLLVILSASGNKLSPGDKASNSNIKMLDVSGKSYSIDDLALKNGVLVVFSSNACPFVLKWESRYSELFEFAKKNDIGMAVLNSNHQNRSGIDSYSAMQSHAKEKGYAFPYLLDEESKIANAFGGQTTPHVFLFDKNLSLVYKGAIDDNYDKAADVKQAFAKNAIAELAAGKTVSVSETKPVGCSIKRKVN
jgi:thioredoxin-related protein